MARWICTVGAPSLLVPALWLAEARGRPAPGLRAEVAILAVLVTTLWWNRERSLRLGAGALSAAFLAGTTAALVHFGPLMGTGGMYLGWILLTVFFFDTLYAPIAVATAVMLGAGLLISGGFIPITWRWPDDGLWGFARMVSTIAALGLLTGYPFLRMTRELVANAQRERLASVGRLASGVAHDLNNVLTVMTGALSTLRAPSDDDARREALIDMQLALDSAQTTARRLLALSRPSSPALVHIDPAAVVTSFAATLSRLLPEDIRVRAVVDTHAKIVFSTGELEQALLNLCLNARDAMPSGGTVTLGVTSAAGPDDRAGVAITVSDTGTGMSEETKERALDLFFTTKAEGHGTGVGLAMVSDAVAHAGGILSLDSKLGHGTRVQLWLPAAAENVPQARKLEAAPSRTERPSGRILLLEDDLTLRRLLTRTLAKAGFVVSAASSNGQARELLTRDDAYDLLVTDVGLPDGSPAGVIAQFRARHAHRPVIVCSGYGDDAPGFSDIDPQSCHFLEKPFSPEALDALVGEVLARPV